MGHGEPDCGWRVSQVESLLNMPRRDITRSCYADRKRGGAGILQPADGTWGRRSYSIEDIAWLYLIKLQHEQGYSLPEIAKRMDTSVGVGALCEHLDAVVNRAAEAYEEAFEMRERARVLHCALTVSPCEVRDAVEGYLRDRVGEETLDIWRCALRRLMRPAVAARRECATWFDAAENDRARRLLDEPGMDLAIELWAGPGAFDRLRDAAIS